MDIFNSSFFLYSPLQKKINYQFHNPSAGNNAGLKPRLWGDEGSVCFTTMLQLLVLIYLSFQGSQIIEKGVGQIEKERMEIQCIRNMCHSPFVEFKFYTKLICKY